MDCTLLLQQALPQTRFAVVLLEMDEEGDLLEGRGTGQGLGLVAGLALAPRVVMEDV